MPYKFDQISVEQTSLCNSKCSMCPREHHYDMPVLTMSMDLFEKVVIDLHDNQLVEGINFGGMGDSSCDKYLVERLRFCKERTPNLKIHVLSNMYSWKKRFTDSIIEDRLTEEIRFSIFSIGEKVSTAVYGRRSQGKKAKENIIYFTEKNKKHGSPIKTSLYTLIVPENEEEVPLIKSTYWDMVDEFEVWRPHNWGNVYNYRSVQQERRMCYRIEDFEVGIKSNGDVCACTMDINHNLKYGNLQSSTLEEIYNSGEYKKNFAI